MGRPPELTARQRQVLDYVASYLADEGFLPTTREIAEACGLRSPTSVRRALHSLEAGGWLIRDPASPRLATVVLPDDAAGAAWAAGGSDVDDELAICDFVLIEMEGAARAAARGVTLAPDLDAQELAHHEALARIHLRRVYLAVRERLVQHGARRQPRADAALMCHQRLLAERLELVTSWDSYCLSTFVLRVAVNDFVTQPAFSNQRHLRHVYAAEVSMLDPDRPADLRAVRDRLQHGDRELTRLHARYGETIHHTFQALALDTPALAEGELGAAIVRTLDSTLGRFGEA